MSPANPSNSDAVLGNTRLPLNAAVLGGLAGAQQRLSSESLFARLQALKDGIQYGSDGINLALQALVDPTDEVKRLARKLLRTQAGSEGKAALLEREPLSYFTTLADWRWETYNPKVGIVDPENNAYVISMTDGLRNYQHSHDLSQFESLIKDKRIGELQALIFQIEPKTNIYSFGMALEAINDARDLFPHLRGLFIGSSLFHRPENRKSDLRVFDIRPFLEAFPDLEILQVYGHFGDFVLECAGIEHQNLKTLIIETADISEENIQQIGAIDMPKLEYFELWLGDINNSPVLVVAALDPILSGKATPALKYLGLRNSKNTDILTTEILKTFIVSQLVILDF
jgi:hypothetical protein